jgi:nicotinamidase-related amidase
MVVSEAMDAERSTLVIVDLQSRLMPAIHDCDAVLRRCTMLARAARLLGIPVLATEQNPEGLGRNVDPIPALADRTIAKIAFDGAAEPFLKEAIDPTRRHLLLAGCEAHVCLMQTALGLAGAGYKVAVAADACGSRRLSDRDAALSRMKRAGLDIVTAEMAVFLWLKRSDHPHFRDVLALVK